MTDQASHRHTEDKIDSTHSANHIVPPKIYITILVALFVLTFITVEVAYVNFSGLWNLVIALGLATVKATIVAMWFMHVRYSGRLIQVVIFATLLFFMLMLFGTLMDVWTRYNVVPTGYTAPQPAPSYIQRDAAGTAVQSDGEVSTGGH